MDTLTGGPSACCSTRARRRIDDKRVRWAVSYYIDRVDLIDLAYDGAGTPSLLPLPSYAPLQRYYDSIEDKLTSTHDTNEYNPAEGGWVDDRCRLLQEL